MDTKLMLSTHAFMHGETECDGGFLSGLYSRRTDDSAGRAASLDQFNTWFIQDDQWAIADVSQVENTFHLLIERDFA